MDENWAQMAETEAALTDDDTVPDTANRDNQDAANKENMDAANREIQEPQTPDIEEENMDAEAKPKRRGRPRKNPPAKDDTDANGIGQLRNEIAQLRKENTSLKDNLRKTEKNLENTESLLAERDEDYNQLLSELSDDSANNSGQSSALPNGLVIYDDICELIANKAMRSGVKWEQMKLNLSALDGDSYEQFDIVVLLTGATDIAGGKSATSLFGTLKEILKKVSLSTTIYCLSLPQNNVNSTQISLFNHRLSTLKMENLHVLKVSCNALRCDLVEEDDITPSPLCIDAYYSVIKEINIPSSPKPQTARAAESPVDFKVSAVMQIKRDVIGKVIGRGGNVIKKISDSNDVKMTIGKWCEQDRENRSDLNVLFDAVLIVGNSKNVKKAMEMVNDVLAEHRDEPVEKKKRF